MKTRKVLVLLMMIAVVAVVGFALWFLFFRVPPPGEELPEEPVNEQPISPLIPSDEGGPTPPTITPPGEIPDTVSPIAQGGVTAVTSVVSNQTAGATLNGNGDISFYDRNDGKFYRVDANGNLASLSSRQFFSVDKATFDPDGSKAIIEYPDGSNIFYDFNSDRQVTLPKHWEEFEFSANGQNLISKSIGTDFDNRYLVVSNPDGTGARPIQEMGNNADKVTVSWSPNNQTVAFSETGDSFGVDSHEVYLIGQNQENFKSMKVEGLDFRPKWNPDGEQLLYSVAGQANDYKPSLWVVDAAGDNIGRNRRNLNIETWADKCTFGDSSTLYCGIPEELERGYGLQPTLADFTPDDIYRIDLNTGLRTRLAVPEGSHTVESLMLSPDERYLYFTDKNTGFINKIQLK